MPKQCLLDWIGSNFEGGATFERSEIIIFKKMQFVAPRFQFFVMNEIYVIYGNPPYKRIWDLLI